MQYNPETKKYHGYVPEPKIELYNIAEDIGETNDLSAQMPGKVKELKEELAAWRDSEGARMPEENPDYDQKNWKHSELRVKYKF